MQYLPPMPLYPPVVVEGCVPAALPVIQGWQVIREQTVFRWGVAQYAAPEALFGADFVTSAYCRTPEGSRRRMLRHLRAILPDVPEGELLALLQG